MKAVMSKTEAALEILRTLYPEKVAQAEKIAANFPDEREEQRGQPTTLPEGYEVGMDDLAMRVQMHGGIGAPTANEDRPQVPDRRGLNDPRCSVAGGIESTCNLGTKGCGIGHVSSVPQPSAEPEQAVDAVRRALNLWWQGENETYTVDEVHRMHNVLRTFAERLKETTRNKSRFMIFANHKERVEDYLDGVQAAAIEELLGEAVRKP